MQNSLTAAARLLTPARHIACLTGAGVSAESGVSTFRDARTRLWSNFDAQQLASQEGFAADPGLVWRWYMERLQQTKSVKPNPGHLALARLAQMFPRFTLITQNVDNLHEEAGSHPVFHLHGEVTRFRCNVCSATYTLVKGDRTAQQPPSCHYCGGMIRPDVVWFGEGLPITVLDNAWQAAEQCDVMLVIGTSGVVYPAAQLPYVATQAGAALIDVNPEPTPFSTLADVFLKGRSGDVVPQLLHALMALERDPDPTFRSSDL